MSLPHFISVVEVLIGAGVMLAAIFGSLRIRAQVPGQLRGKWLLMVVLMVCFFCGYLLFVGSLMAQWWISLELVTGTVFMGGAFFVIAFLHISDLTLRESLKKSRDLEAEIAERNVREKERQRYQQGFEVLDRCTRSLIAGAGDPKMFYPKNGGWLISSWCWKAL